MKLPTLALLMVFTAYHVQAQPTNIAPNSSQRLQTIIKRAGPPGTNAPSNAGTNVGKPFADRLIGEFIGTLIAVDKENQSVSIASGPPGRSQGDKATVFSLTPQTKLFKGEVPAALDEAIIGQEIRYGLRFDRESGKRQVTTLRFLTDDKRPSPSQTVQPKKISESPPNSVTGTNRAQ
jgi:hypothetical protein